MPRRRSIIEKEELKKNLTAEEKYQGMKRALTIDSKLANDTAEEHYV